MWAMEHRRIIWKLMDALGTQADVGAWFGVAGSTVSHWQDDGIPARYWPALLRLAQSKGIRLSLEDIERHSPLRAA